jgi:hypothetical protein
MVAAFEALMPISDREKVRRNVDRAIMAFDSLNFFWRDEGRPLTVHVVMPDSEFDCLRDAFSAHVHRLNNIVFNFRRESEISPVFGDFEGRGIAKQMLIKLAAFTFVRSRFYLTLDSDIVACKPVGLHNLVKGGLALSDLEVPSTTSWWLQSAKILGVDAQLSKPRMFVTPQILSSDVCRQLAEFLTQRFSSEDWMRGLLNRYSGQHPDIWTEYSLYDLFAEANGLTSEYYLPAGNDRLQSTQNGIWYAEQFVNWAPESAISGESPGYFLALQSITAQALDFDTVRSRWIEAVSTIYPDYPVMAS